MIQRRDLLKAAVALPALATGAAEVEARRKHLKGMNVVLFITDQQRALQHFPKQWGKKNLPGTHRLRTQGLSFERAFCNSCMCSPSRATLLTGFFPAQHGVKYTLEEDMPDDQYPQVELPLDFKNVASVMSAAGYHVPFKGKWHLSKKLGSDWTPEVVNQYGFERWDPPDAGANQDLDQFGGGDANNDGRYMDDGGLPATGNEGVLAYLNSVAAREQPFFLIVSLVNPHDVLSYPKDYDTGGYTNADLQGDIGLPETVNEDLSSKPSAQMQFLALNAAGLGPLNTNQKKLDYLNFYGNLMKESDAYLVKILNALDDQGLTDNTLVIQTSDHGELGMAHGGLRQKSFNFYEETMRVSLIYSNPKLFPKKKKTKAIVSHVDFLPTIASLFQAPAAATTDWQGVDYSKVVLDPGKKGPQKYTVFTYDDFQCGQASGPYVQPPNHITSIREGRYKLAKYFDPDGGVPIQWEMYDLKNDPNETKNLTAPGFKRNKRQQQEYSRLKDKLTKVENTRLQPL